jgi:hypothetical protein
MLSTLFNRKSKIFLDQATISSNLAKAKALKVNVDQFFNLDQIIELFRITSDLQDSIGITQTDRMTHQELELYQTLIVWGRNKEGMNQADIGLIPCSKTIYLGGKAELAKHTLNHYRTELVRNIDIMFDLKDHYHPIIQEALDLIISNLENLEKSK